MSRRFFSDRSGDRVAHADLTELKISSRSPLYNQFGGAIHLTSEEALDLAEWLGKPMRAIPPDRANDGLDALATSGAGAD